MINTKSQWLIQRSSSWATNCHDPYGCYQQLLSDNSAWLYYISLRSTEVVKYSTYRRIANTMMMDQTSAMVIQMKGYQDILLLTMMTNDERWDNSESHHILVWFHTQCWSPMMSTMMIFTKMRIKRSKDFCCNLLREKMANDDRWNIPDSYASSVISTFW